MILAHVLILTLSLLASAFFSGIETGIVSMHRFRLRHLVRQGHRNAKILEFFAENFDRLLGTTLVGNNIVLVIMSVATSSLAMELHIPAAQMVAPVVVSVVVIIFGEYLPKAWFQARPIERSNRFAGILRAAEWLLRPMAYCFIAVARLLSPGERDKNFGKPAPFVTRDDLKVLAREGEKDGVLSAKERYMIHRVIELSTTKASSIMVPRDKVVTVFDDLPIPDFFALARETGLTRFPTVNRETGNFSGVINVSYVLAIGSAALSKTVYAYRRPPLFIANTLPADRILPQMRRSRQPLCLVRDPKGDVIGLVTTEDILRIIVGKL